MEKPKIIEDNIIKLVPSSRLFLGIFILSSAVVIFEIVVTRISSLVFTYNYAFMVVSLAILGLGCGGIFANYKWKNKNLINSDKIYKVLSFNCVIFSIFIIIFIILVTKLLIFTSLFLYFTIAFIPFFFAGIIFSITFQFFGWESFKLYFFDLFGAATGAIIAILFLDKLGGIDSIISISILGLIASFLFIKEYSIKAKQLKQLSSYSIIALILIILFLSNVFSGFLGEIPIRESIEKDLYLLLNLPNSRAEIVESRWSHFGRVDLVRSTIDDRVKFLFIDGAAGTPMFKFDGDLKNAYGNLDFLSMTFSGNIPFLFMDEDEKDNMLIIGPGGGREIIIGLSNGVKNIVGVEINEDFVDIVKEYKEYNGGIYTDFDNVEIIVNEGRSYIRSIKDKFDIILITQPYTESSRSIKGYSLTENYLFTIEAVKDYLNHLTEEGRIIVVLHNTNEIMRFITTSIKALEYMNLNNAEAMDYLYTIGPEINPVLVIKKSPLTLDESQEIYKYILDLGLFSSLTYIPFIKQNNIFIKNKDGSISEQNILNGDLMSLSKGEVSLEDLVKKSSFNINPITDDRPFFFKDEKGIPKNILPILLITIIVNLLVVVFSILKARANNGNKIIIKLLLLSLLLGFGFMAIEITFFQKFILFMGSPIASLSVILGSILFGMGIGSLSGRKIIRNQKIKRLILINIIIFFTTIILFYSISPILNNFLGLNILIRALISSFILVPLGFILGIPFPTGIILAKETGVSSYITWMYGINGTMSVLGAVVTISISTIFGFQVSLILGACCYLLIAIIFAIRKRRLN